jgi:hypothetical protein
MYKKNKIPLLFSMVFLMIGLLSALVPLSDFDQDGNLDSLVTEGFLLIPMLCTVTGLFCIWVKLPAICLAVPQSLPSLIVPPPIPTE